MENGIVHRKKKLVYWFVPKNACTSLKKLFADDMGLKYENIHSAPFERITRKGAGGFSEFCHFAIVRNPFDRLLSCYLDKIRPGFRGHGFPQGVAYNFKPHGFHEKMSFEDFVNHIIDNGLMNPHWLPQTDMIPDIPMLIFKFRDLNTHFTAFLEVHGFDELPHRNRSKNTDVDYREYYTDGIREKATKYYLNDLKLGFTFG